MSAFFSGMEMAFVSANKLEVELENQKGSKAGKMVAAYIQQPTRFINTILIGNNISLVILSLSASKLLEPVLMQLFNSEPGVLLVQTLITTIILLVFGEFIPKALFRVYANPILKVLIFPFNAIYFLLWFVVKFFGFISVGILRLFGVKLTEKENQFTPIDLEHFVKEHSISEDQDRDIDIDLFENALHLKDTKVKECMVPRTELTAVEESISVAELRKVITETRHSRILVYKESIDQIIGYVHHFSLLLRTGDIKDMLMPIKPVTETAPAQELMNEFIREGRNIAYVVDEYGGTAGIITLEDILEEIFGEIQDEHDDEEILAKQIGENEYQLAARIEVDRLNSDFDLQIPEGDYETIGGFILAHHENIPELEQVIEIENFIFTILEGTEKKIETVKLVVDDDKMHLLD